MFVGGVEDVLAVPGQLDEHFAAVGDDGHLGFGFVGGDFFRAAFAALRFPFHAEQFEVHAAFIQAVGDQPFLDGLRHGLRAA